MTCDEAKQLLTAFADDALDAVTHHEVEKHLAECKECRRELADIHQLLAAIEQSVPAVPGTAMHEIFTAMLQAEINILATETLVQQQPAK